MGTQGDSSLLLVEPWSDLRGKVVMVTGVSSGLGRDFCLDLAQAGCRIVAAARRVDRLKSLCDEINSLTLNLPASSSSSASESAVQPQAISVELDVTADGPTIQRSVQKAWDAFGRIDTLINNAGIRAGGFLINISSASGLTRGQLPGGVAYCASKAALNTMSTVMALELGKHKIRVNGVSPGLFKSEITENLMQKEWLNNVAVRCVPLRTFGTSNPAFTSIIRYLIHDSSEYVTGNNFIVDAGLTLPGVPIFSSL